MTLGLVATGKRAIRSGAQYNAFIDTSVVQGNETTLQEGTPYDTLQQMKSIVGKTLDQTKAIARKLKRPTLEATCENLWNFLYHHVQYKKDNATREQLRTPARTWKDRKSGVDCDCYSIFISSVLSNLKVTHFFRMAGYQGDFQHVYVVVPANGKSMTATRSSYLVIDPVVNKFNYEVPFSKKHDHKAMAKVTMLNGVDGCEKKQPISERLRRFVDASQVLANGLIPTEMFLAQNKIPYVHGINESTEGGVLIIGTPTGSKMVPTIITTAQAEQLKAAVIGDATEAAEPVAEKTKKKFPWWWLAVAAAGWVLLTGDDQDEVKTGLKGVPRAAVKRSAKKYKTIRI